MPLPPTGKNLRCSMMCLSASWAGAGEDDMKFRKINNEVLYPAAAPVELKSRDLKFLKAAAGRNPRQTIRICAHANEKEKVHEMFIVHSRGTYVRPHRHAHKQESFFLIEGRAEAIFFNPE